MKKVAIFFLAILVIASFFRLWHLDSIPPGLYPDEAMNGVNALEAIDTGKYKVFYPENNGREGLFINIQSLSVRIFGNTPFALRIISAIFGSLTIPGVFLFLWFLLKKEGSDSDNKPAFRVAFFSSLFMALSFWHLNFSRIGFRAITMPFCIIYSLLFFILGLRYWQKSKLSIFSFVASGIFLGLGLHGYTPFRLIPFLFVAALIILFFKKIVPTKSLIFRFSLLVIASVLIFSPLLFYFYQNPQDFSNRNNKIYFFQQEKPLKELMTTLAKYLIMFNIRGDCNSRHNFACKPQLNYFAGVLFLVGFIGIWFKKFKNNFGSQYLWLIPLGFFATILPAILASEGAPHALRAIGTIPFVFAFLGLGIEIIYQNLIKLPPSFKKVVLKFIFYLMIIAALFIDPYNYFVKWPKSNPDFSQNYLAEAFFLKRFPKFQKIIIVNASTGVKDKGFPTTIMTSKYILWQEIKNNTFSYIFPDEINKISLKIPFIITSLQPDQSLFLELKNRFPQGDTFEEKVDGGSFMYFIVNK